MNRIPNNAAFVRLAAEGVSLHLTRDGLVAKKPPWHTTIVYLLVELHALSPKEYEEYRNGDRDLGQLFLDPRLFGYPTWTSLAHDRRYQFRPVARYFLDADAFGAAGPEGGLERSEMP